MKWFCSKGSIARTHRIAYYQNGFGRPSEGYVVWFIGLGPTWFRTLGGYVPCNHLLALVFNVVVWSRENYAEILVFEFKIVKKLFLISYLFKQIVILTPNVVLVAYLPGAAPNGTHNHNTVFVFAHD